MINRENSSPAKGKGASKHKTFIPMQTSLYARTRAFLNDYQIHPSKRLSQNFLIDENIFAKIRVAVTHEKAECILELGAGLGFLTEALCESAASIIALELDQKLYQGLHERFQSKKNVRVLQGNILQFNPALYFQPGEGVALGNLPYHISGAILRWFLEHRQFFHDAYFMLQKEVADRILAKPGTKIYGVLSLLCQYYTETKFLFDVPAGAFFPTPKVDSAFIKMTPKPVSENPLFVRLVKQAFHQRRKTIYNNLKSWNILTPEAWEALLMELKIEKRERAEKLSLETFVRMAGTLRKHSGAPD